ncbi:DUF2207 domain-containing protein [Rossellomorea vietnamensis]|uniref:DUF2207 domain-containing protein n=1 Tax=Rossellomorea vietnamensis TaxID=218284 RepID=A0A6I6UFJ1_9BACI|nr:DUF2207 domain-containing protein [Rossellomorea vietnamensis]QHE60277.1 DUF2207 domain-containing protein [Rossellomorea vietnamensis]
MFKKLAILLILLFSFGQTAYAKSYSIDEVQIRAWIQPNGNLLVNELFTYTFDGKYKSIRRAVHEDNHEGVQWFKASEVINDEAKLGFIEDGDLRQLDVKREDGTYRSSFPVEDATKTFLFAYELKDAVKSYDSYSDVTVPFFGTDTNHDIDLHNVTIDFVFPEKLDPAEYHAFFHGPKGKVEEEGPEVVRFTTPVSNMYSLTETRVLFPSSVMSEQEKTAAPQSLEAAIQEEEDRLALVAQRETQMKTYNDVLGGLAVILGGALFIMMLGFLLGRIRGSGRTRDVLEADPLLLYMVHRRGKFTHGALMAGLYSLVERGKATVRRQKTTTRFLNDGRSPDETLFFTLTSEGQLSAMEEKLASWIFKRRGKNGSASFAMTDLAGATKSEKDFSRHVKKYHTKVKTLKEQEREWFAEVLKEAKEAGLLHDRWFHFITKLTPLSVVVGTLWAYHFDMQSTFAMWLYGIIGCGSLVFLWWKKEKKWPLLVFGVISFFAAAQIKDETAIALLLLCLLLTLLLLFFVPRHTLSGAALDVKAGIRRFRKQVKREGYPKGTSEEMDVWMIRTLLFERKRKLKRMTGAGMEDSKLFSAAPLTALILSGQDPHEFLTNSWKWSGPPPSMSSGSSDGGFSGGGGGFDGGGGGGAGAD